MAGMVLDIDRAAEASVVLTEVANVAVREALSDLAKILGEVDENPAAQDAIKACAKAEQWYNNEALALLKNVKEANNGVPELANAINKVNVDVMKTTSVNDNVDELDVTPVRI